MDELFQLLGLALPDTATIFRLKVVFGRICGLGAGLLFMASGLDDALTWGALMAACGLALIGIAAHSSACAARRATAERERLPSSCALTSPARRLIVSRAHR
jgi:hypothetical protein